MNTSVEQFLPLLIQTRLFDAQSATAALERWRESAGADAVDVEQWRRWLVEEHLLTEYQASLLGRGHTEGFFLGEYKILDRIGRGRMAGVYRATDSEGSVVAIKVLPPSRAKDPVLLARFQREARITQTLAHLNVMRAREVGKSGDFNYLVMDYLNGETLDSILHRRRRLGIDESVELLEQALTGLQHIHDLGLIHRDIKPGNLMMLPRPAPDQPDVTTGCILKILDFGLSRTVAEDPGPEPVQNLELTAAGAILGTPDYIAPEQARDARTADIRADIYSLGCVAYHLLSGRPPFPDRNAIRQMVRHATETAPPLEQVRPDAPVFLQRIVSRMLAKDPDERFATPLQALQALRGNARETESFVAAQAPPETEATPGTIVALSELPSVDFGFAGADAPTAKQDVFIPSPADSATKTGIGANTPLEIDNVVTKSDRANPLHAAPALPITPKRKPKTAERQRSASREIKEQRVTPLPADIPERPHSSWRMSRRDAVMFAAGATTVLLALSLGALFSWISRAQ